jgi:hypothetical protein
MITRRRISAAVVAVVGAVGVTASAYLDWYSGRTAKDTPLERLFQTDITSGTASSYWNSVALPLAIVAVLGVVGAVLLSRFILGLGWLIGVATLVLWIVMQANDDAVDFSVSDLQAGPWVCAAALLVMLVGIGAMTRPEVDHVTVVQEPVHSDEPDV